MMTAQTAWVRWASVVSALVVCQLLWQVAPASAQGWSGVLTDVSGYATPQGDLRYDGHDLAVDGAGNAFAVWTLRGAPTVQVARYTAGSKVWSNPVSIAPGDSSAEYARVAMDESGNAVVVWNDSGGMIRSARYVVATDMWTAPVTISDPTMGSPYKPHLAVDPVGNALVVWRLRIPRAGYSEYVVQGVRFTAASATWSSPVALGAMMGWNTARSDADKLAVAADRFGNGVAVWKQVEGVQAARYRAASGWGPAVDLTAPGQEGFRPSVAVDHSGNATVIWVDQLQGLGAARTVRYTAASDGWSSPFELTADVQSTSYPQLVVDAAGDVTAIWEWSGLRARRYVAASATWQQTRIVVSPGPGEIHNRPQVTVDGQGIVTAVWENYKIIQSARYTPATDTWSSPVSLSRMNAYNYRESHLPQVGADTAGNVVVVWSQFHIPGEVIQSTRWQVSGAVNNTVPSGLTSVLPPSSTRLTLLWVAPPATVTSYVVEAGSSPGAADLAQLDTGDTRPVLEVQAPAGVYHVRVRSNIGGILGLPSNEVKLTVGSPCSVPAAPANLTNTTASTSVSLSWQAGAGAISYVLEAGSGPGLSNVAVLNTSSSATTFSTAAPPGLYYVRIRSQNACGISAPSNETTVTIGCSPPSAPGMLSATVSGSNVALSWGPATGASSYVLEAGSAPGASNLGQFATASPGLAASAPPGIYYVRVRARSACGAGPASNEVIVTVQ